MYCPVDGVEWREGITHCPEHHVDLVEDPPEGYEDQYSEDEVTVLDRAGLEGLAGYAAVVVFVAAVVYAVAGVVSAGWVALAAAKEWYEPGPYEIVRFVVDGSRAVAVGGLGCIAAGVLGRAWVRLAGPPGPASNSSASEVEGAGGGLEGPSGWAISLLTSLAVVFAIVWGATGVAVSWDTLAVQRESFSPFGPDDPSDTFLTLTAINNAAYYCAVAALASMGALVMARGYRRIGRRR